MTVSDRSFDGDFAHTIPPWQIATPRVNFASFTLSRAQSGFWAFKVDRNERVGPWNTSVWFVDSLEIITKKRTEHLEANPPPPNLPSDDATTVDPSDEEESESETEDEKIRKYDAGMREEDIAEEKGYKRAKRAFRKLAQFRPTLDPPPKPTVEYEEFFEKGRERAYLHVGRPLKLEEKSRSFTATLWMHEGGEDWENREFPDGGSTEHDHGYQPPRFAPTSSGTIPPASADPSTTLPSIRSDSFPLKLSTLLPLLDLIGMGSNEHIRSLREFFNVQLPPGFPVKVEIPVGMLPLSAVVTFQNISSTCVIDDQVFVVPGKKQGYRFGEVVKGSEGQ
ncbi:Ankyrin repeat domain-containing protein 13C [Borealophlyctis nickersoniae]|nr:Ankyrin repeat domain-containing protein 13C [Borealophlyctis nickersoniae]